MRRRRHGPLIGIGLLALAAVEIALIVVVGQAIGAMPTIIVLIVGSGAGIGVVKSAGVRAFRSLRESDRSGAAPGSGLADSAVLFVGGVLLMIPGFVTDALGLICVLPFTRPLARRVLGAFTAWRIVTYRDTPYADSRHGVHRIYRDTD